MSEPTTCAICLEIVADTDRFVESCESKHVFHAPCASQWRAEKGTCAICRGVTDPNRTERRERLLSWAEPGMGVPTMADVRARASRIIEDTMRANRGMRVNASQPAEWELEAEARRLAFVRNPNAAMAHQPRWYDVPRAERMAHWNRIATGPSGPIHERAERLERQFRWIRAPSFEYASGEDIGAPPVSDQDVERLLSRMRPRRPEVRQRKCMRARRITSRAELPIALAVVWASIVALLMLQNHN
jgi:hypothetical protein